MKMKEVKLNEIDPYEGTILYKEIDRSIINGIRRILISEIPSYCLDTIELKKNNTIMNDEYLVHRIGLIPFTFVENEENFRNQEDCNCINGCEKCHLYFSLEKENNTDELLPVYSSDFQLKSNKNYNIKPVEFKNFKNGILICYLDKNEYISLRGRIHKGIGKDHAKWSCVSNTSFKEISSIKIMKDKLSEEETNKVISSCPVNLFYQEDGILKIKNEENCIQCSQCTENTNIEYTYHPKDFLMNIESNGSYTIKDLFLKSLSILDQKLNSLKV
jgi:DNA-directed RNA polymerase II subunit RPB3